MQNKLFAVLFKHSREIRSRHPGEGPKKRKQTGPPENFGTAIYLVFCID